MVWIWMTLILVSCMHVDQVDTSNLSLPVVELFTSEGCSSCPPADLVLKELVENKSAICLSFHVDYWDRLGWKDPFSQAAFSERQREYSTHFKESSVYTPQMIVNGQNVFVGSNRNALKSALAAKYKDAPVLLEGIKLSKIGKITKIEVPVPLSYEGQNLCLATCIASASTSVKRGENNGKLLKHVQIVSDLQILKIGNEEKYTFESMPSDPASNWVVFIQNAGSMHIVAANFVAGSNN
ncbi:MAG: DUF1223 domain-containing protein [Saprospiraceae bacterium]